MIAGGFVYWLGARHFETTDDAFIDSYTTQMAPRVAGQVTKLLFADNEHVAAGQTLLLIDPRDYQAKLDQAKAQQASAEASSPRLRRRFPCSRPISIRPWPTYGWRKPTCCRLGRITIATSTIASGAVSRQQIEAATATFHSAQAKLDASRQMVGGAQAQVRAAQAQVLAAQASLQQAAANTQTAELQLSYCTIVAPVAGIVTHRTVSCRQLRQCRPGAVCPCAGRPLGDRQFQGDPTRRHAPGPGRRSCHRRGAVVTFHGKVDSFQAGTGTAFSVLPAENATGNYVKIVQRLPVKIVFDDPRLKDYKLAPGMSVTPSVRVR